ncbi:hypothetical protein EGR_03513 [Echinococcus granulosus]|uniref:Uncharacterized protein n=1 Tax=Echinococcus granulosus TaxID=6210 RepID=W6V5S0_ECHGR|nr:hypothetical protein EGR_03513 [Echinococcus granulosus]EUB61699.1 hypothetical protein EGR_03513 [Echinococcus granulosus]
MQIICFITYVKQYCKLFPTPQALLLFTTVYTLFTADAENKRNQSFSSSFSLSSSFSWRGYTFMATELVQPANESL